jgi:hypothetical protein
MVHLGAQAELHNDGTHLLLRTYFSDGLYGYLVQNLYGGMPVALCEERFNSPEEAMRKAEEVASRAVGIGHVPVKWTPTRTIVSRGEQSRLFSLPLNRHNNTKESAS